MRQSSSSISAAQLALVPTESAPVDEALIRAVADALVEPLAMRVVALLQATPPAPATPAGALVTADEVASALAISRDTVYRHKHELGAVEMGQGRRPRLRFDLDEARRRWQVRNSEALQAARSGPVRARPRRRKRVATGDLLPVRGTVPAADRQRQR